MEDVLHREQSAPAYLLSSNSKMNQNSIHICLTMYDSGWWHQKRTLLANDKVGRLQPFYLCLSRLGCSLGELQDDRPDKFCQAQHHEDKISASIYGQDMELLMTESHMHLRDIKSSPYLTGHNNFRSMSSIRLNLLTKTTWKLKTPGGILVFRVLVQIWQMMADNQEYQVWLW